MTLAAETRNTKEKIVHCAAELLAQGGREAVSTRAVAAAAGVQAPTIYRHFSDMRELLDAVASYGFETYLREKTSRNHLADPVEELRQGWDRHVDFGLANPGFYALMYGDPRPEVEFTAASRAAEALRALARRVAEAGRLQVGVERAVQMIHAAAGGVTLTLLELPPGERDLGLSAQTREVILSAITLPSADTATSSRQGVQSRVVSHAVALKALLPKVTALTPGERTLLSEWLERLSEG